jgi:hypothetical protein
LPSISSAVRCSFGMTRLSLRHLLSMSVHSYID